MTSLRPLLAAFVLPLTVATAQSLATSADLSATWNDNLSRAMHSEDHRTALAFDASAGVDDRTPLTRDLALLAGISATVESCSRYHGLNSIAAAGHAGLRQKFGLGPLAPVLSLDGRLGAAAFQESARNDWSAAVALGLSKRFDDAWRAAVSADWSRDDARRPVFARENRSVSAEVTWDVSENWQIGAGAARQWGVVVANSSWKNWQADSAGAGGPALAAYYNGLVDDFSNTFGPGWVVYRFQGQVNRGWISLSPALTPTTALPLRFETVQVHGGAGTSYTSHVVSLSLVHQF